MLGHCTKVMIVEDDPLIALMMEQMVEDLGYWVVGPLHCLQDAIDHANDDDIDFALLDFNLGNGTDAIPVVEVLRSRGLPFVITTGTSPDLIRQQLPDCTIIGKPVVESELEHVLP